ncbi:MAG TPA: AAA family ATPase [Acidimicrobiales bacterium]
MESPAGGVVAMQREMGSVPALAMRPGGVGMARLYEREEALAALDAAVCAARRGEGRAIFFVGEAGQGKTSLLSVARERYQDAMTTRSARGHAMESDLPFAFAEQASDLVGSASAGSTASSDEEAGIVVEGEGDVGVDALGRRTELFAVARRRLRRLAAERPVLLLLDDIHWADLDSLRLLVYLVRRSAQLPVAVVGTLRPWPHGAQAAIDVLAVDGLVEVVRLHPLSEPASAALLASLTASALEGEQAARAWRLTAGNPLLLIEAARVLRDHGRLPVPGHSEPIAQASTLLLSHVAGLPADTLGVVQAAAVLGQSFSLGVLEWVSGLEAEAFARAFDVAVLAGLLRSDGTGRGAFHHELLAASIYADTPPARRRLLHARAFDHCVAVGDEEAAVPHVLAGALGDDPRAAPLLARAGARALRDGAVETGLSHLRRAVDVSGGSAPDDLLESLADALFLAGLFDEAIGVYRRLLARPDPADGAGGAEVDRAGVAAKEARTLVYAGHIEEAMAVFDQLVAEAAAAGDVWRLAPLLLERGHALWETAGPAAGNASLALADEFKIPSPLGELVTGMRAGYRHHLGDLSGLPEIERQALETRRMSLAGHGPNPEISTNAFIHQVAVCGAMERFDEAEIYVQMALKEFARVGALLPSVPLRMQRISILQVRGELAAAMAALDDLDEEFDVGSLLLPYFLQVRARTLCLLGDYEGASRARAEALGLAGSRTWFVRIALGMAEGHELLFGGEAAAATDVFGRVEQVARDHDFKNPTILMWPAGAIEAGLAAGRLDDVARVVDLLEEQTRGFGIHWPRMLALGGRAGLAAAAGDGAAAERLYEEALALPCVVPLDRMPIAVRYGRWLRQHHQALRARTVLAGALETAEALGARPMAEAAHAELAAAGGRRRRTARGRGGVGGAQQGDGGTGLLTTQQARVAALAVTGATTKEIAQSLYLSPRTVESHLAQVFVRLEVRSKAELRRRRGEFAAQLECETDS